MAEQKKRPLNFINAANDTLEGFEDINAQTMAIPFVKLLQPLSPQVDKKKPEYVEGAEPGMFFNNVTKEIYGESINIIILKFEHLFIEWVPDRGGFVDVHSPENAAKITVSTEFNSWKTEDGNDLQETYCYFLLIEEHEKEGVAIMSLSSSAIKVAKQINRLITSHVMENGIKAKPYYLVLNLKSEYKTNDKGSWYLPVATFSDYINEEQYNIVSPERIALPDRTVDYAQLEATTGSTKESKETPKTGKKIPY